MSFVIVGLAAIAPDAHAINAAASEPLTTGVVATVPSVAVPDRIWPAPDGSYVVRFVEQSGANPASYLVDLTTTSSAPYVGIQFAEQILDLTFGPDSTAYFGLTGLSGGQLAKLPRGASNAEVLYDWSNEVDAQRQPYSVEFVDGALFVEAMQPNVFFSCRVEFQKFDTTGQLLGTMTQAPTSCGGHWQGADHVVSGIDYENYDLSFIDPATLAETAQPLPGVGTIREAAPGHDGSWAVRFGGSTYSSCDGRIARIGQAGTIYDRALTDLLAFDTSQSCIAAGLAVLTDLRVVVAAQDAGGVVHMDLLGTDGTATEIAQYQDVNQLRLGDDGHGHVLVTHTEQTYCTQPNPVLLCYPTTVDVMDTSGVVLSSTLLPGTDIAMSEATGPIEAGDGAVAVAMRNYTCAGCLGTWNYVSEVLFVIAPTSRDTWHDPANGLPTPPPNDVLKYVALGDSYSAGEGIDPYFRDGYDSTGTQTGSVDNRCHRSTRAYAEYVKPADYISSLYVLASGGGDSGSGKRINKYGSDLNVRQANNVAWGFFACSGAVTKNVLPASEGGEVQRSSGGYAEIDPQLDYPFVDSSTDLVTITIGGNDIKFSEVLTYCFLNSCNTPGYQTALSDSIDQLRPDLVKVYQAIRDKAPHARVLVMGYPQLFPESSVDQNCTKLRPWRGEQDMLRAAHDHLNATIQQAASEAGVEYRGVDGLFAGHEVCGPLGEWINGPSASYKVHRRGGGILGPPTDDESFHPNLLGQQGYATSINQILGSA